MTLPLLTLQADNVGFFISEREHLQLIHLPWKFPLEIWNEHKVNMLQIKSGLSRQVVRFIESGRHRYAVKETALESAHREFETYTRLIAMEVPTLTPIGVVARNDGIIVVDTFVGKQPEPQMTGYLITELMEKVIPDSLRFRGAFTRESRVRIWDAALDLFVRMQSRGVYWGDASLANMLIHFSTEQVPELGQRTRLQAVLAGEETVEIHPTISEKTASSLYVEIMEHKYFMSEREKQDVGLVAAVEDYCAKFALREPLHFTLTSILDAIRKLLDRYTAGSAAVYLA